MKTLKTLIHLTSENSVDHLSSLIWYLLINDHKVKLFFLRNYNYKNDLRIKYFQSFENFKIIQKHEYFENRFNFFLIRIINFCTKYLYDTFPKSNSIIYKFFSKIIKKISKLKTLDIDFIFYQWGEFSHHIYPSKFFGISTIAMPHGFNIYLNEDTNYELKKNLQDKSKLKKIFSNHNIYDHYIVENQITKLRTINLGIDKKKIKIWGTPRYSKKWINFNYENFEKNVKSEKRILFLLPHWSFKINIDDTFDLIKSIILKYPNQLTLKPHIRKKNNIYDDRANDLLDHFIKNHGVNVASDVRTPSLISSHDVILGFGTSIIIDALYLKKKLLITDYLQENQTIYSEMNLPNITYSKEDCLKKIDNNQLNNLDQKNFRLLEEKYIKHLNNKLDILDNYLIKLLEI
tara:strand:+ start:10593 stop:11804 length:1212 start_codon:yes stop_codon:yes gene_type:complete